MNGDGRTYTSDRTDAGTAACLFYLPLQSPRLLPLPKCSDGAKHTNTFLAFLPQKGAPKGAPARKPALVNAQIGRCPVQACYIPTNPQPNTGCMPRNGPTTVPAVQPS